MVPVQGRQEQSPAEGQEQLFAKGTNPCPWGKDFTAFEFTKLEPGGAFRSKSPSVEGPEIHGLGLGAPGISWRQDVSSKEGQTLPGYSSLVTPEFILQIKSNQINLISSCWNISAYRDQGTVVTFEDCAHRLAPRGSSECVLAAHVLPSEPGRLLHPVMLSINKQNRQRNCHPVSTF